MKSIHEFNGQEGKIVLTLADCGSYLHAVLEPDDNVGERDADAFFSWFTVAKRRLFTKPTVFDAPDGRTLIWPERGRIRAEMVTSPCVLLWFEQDGKS